MFFWNDLVNAVIYLPSNMDDDRDGRASAVSDQYAGQRPLMMAGSLLAVAPIIIVFFLAGISMSGLK